jgi:hypothetical protein
MEKARFAAWAKEMTNREDSRAAREEARAKREEALTDRIAELERRTERPSGAITARERGGANEATERARPEHGWRLPADTSLALGAASVGGAASIAAEYARYIPQTYATIGATVLAVGAAGVAWWRERRKAEADGEHQS